MANTFGAPTPDADQASQTREDTRARRTSEPRRAANDPARNELARLQAELKEPASTTPYWVAALASLIWLLVSAAVGWGLYGERLLQGVSPVEFLNEPRALALIVGAVLPVLVFFVMAGSARRAAHLRRTADVMSRIALRVAEGGAAAPREANGQFGQSVRGEIEAMSSAVERAIGRAGELEALVQNEIGTLERAYSDNEARIRRIVEDLVSERESVVHNAERVRAAINTAQSNLGGELATLSAQIEADIANAAAAASASLAAKGQDMAATLFASGSETLTRFENAADERQQAFDAQIAATDARFEDGLTRYTARMDEQMEGALASVEQTLQARADSIAEGLTAASTSATQALEDAGARNRNAIAAEQAAFAAALAAQADSTKDDLDTLNERIGSQILGRTTELTGALDAAATRMDATLETYGPLLADKVAGAMTQLSEAAAAQQDVVTLQAERAESSLRDATAKIEGTFLTAGDNAASALQSAADIAFNGLADRAGVAIRDVEDITDAMIEKVETNARRIETDLRDATSGLDDALRVRGESLLRDLGEQTGLLTASLSARTADLDALFSTGRDDYDRALSESLRKIETTVDERASNVVSLFNETGDTLAERLQAVAEGGRDTLRSVGNDLTANVDGLTRTIASTSETAAGLLAQTGDALTTRLQAAAESGRESLRSTGDALAMDVDNLTRSLTATGETVQNELTGRVEDASQRVAEMVRAGVTTTIADAYGVFEMQANSLTAEIDTRLGALNNVIGTDGAALSAALAAHAAGLRTLVERDVIDAAESLNARIGETTQRFSDQAQALDIAVTEKAPRLIEALETSRGDLVGRLDSIQTTIADANTAIDERLERVRGTLGDSQEKFGKDLENNALRIADVLASASKVLENATEQGRDAMRHTLEEADAKSAQMLDERAGAISASVAARVADAARMLTDHVGDVEASITRGVETLIERAEAATVKADELMAARAYSLDESVETGLGRIDTTLGARTTEINRLLGEGLQNLKTETLSVSNLLTQHIGDVSDAIEHAAAQAGERSSESSAAAAAHIAARLAEGEAALAARSQTLSEDVTRIAETLQASVSATEARMRDTLAREAGQIVEVVNASSSRFDEASRDRLGALERTFDAALAATGEALSTQASTIERQLGDRLDKAMLSFRTATNDLDALSNERTDGIVRVMAEGTETFNRRTQIVLDVLDQRTRDVDAMILERAEALRVGAAEQVARIEANMREAMSRTTSDLEVQAGELEAMMTALRASAETSIAASADRAAETVGTELARVAHAFDAGTSNVVSIANGRSADLDVKLARVSEAFERGTNALMDAADGQSARVAELLTRESAGTVAAIEEASSRATDVTRQLDNALQQRNLQLGDILTAGERLVASLGERGTATAEGLATAVAQMEAALDAQAGALTDGLRTTLEGRVAALAGLLDDRGGELTRRLETLSGTLGDILDARSTDLTQTIDEKGNALVGAMDQASDALRGRMSEITERISDAARTVADGSSRAVQELSSVESRLSDQAVALRDVLDTVTRDAATASGTLSDRLETLRGSATTLLSELSGVSERFAEQTQSLADATRAVAEVNERADATFSGQRDMLGALAGDLTGQVETLDDRVRDLTARLERALAKAQERSEAASDTLARTASQMEADVLASLDKLSSVAAERGSRMDETVRASTAAAAAELTRSLDTAMQQMAASADEMRGLSASVTAEIARTQDAVRQATVDLPKEAEAGASDMRRVVADQLKVLRELADIAGRQANSLDVGAVSRAVAAAPAPTEPTAARRRTELERTVVTSSLAEPAPAPQTPTLVVTEPKPAPTPEAPVAVAEPPKPSRQQVKVERTPVHMVESLNSLSVDIARAIDHDAFLTLWDRYTNGERNVFTRRLYTLQGQKTYDDIRRRYENDKEFRGAVERYLEDFENLLRQVARDETDKEAQDTLTSDTGKVYTMLAHASGRLR